MASDIERARIVGMFLGTIPSVLHDMDVVLRHADLSPHDRDRLQGAHNRLNNAYLRGDEASEDIRASERA